jgi:hypothetical protein
VADAIRVGLDRVVFDALGSETLEECVEPGNGEGDPAWREFLRGQAASIVACDFFTVESVFLRRYYVLFFIARVLR